MFPAGLGCDGGVSTLVSHHHSSFYSCVTSSRLRSLGTVALQRNVYVYVCVYMCVYLCASVCVCVCTGGKPTQPGRGSLAAQTWCSCRLPACPLQPFASVSRACGNERWAQCRGNALFRPSDTNTNTDTDTDTDTSTNTDTDNTTL